jgi:serine/threonine protein kinase
MPNPNLLAPDAAETSGRSRSRQRASTEANANGHRSSMWDPLKKIGSWFRHEEEEPPPSKLERRVDEENKENGRPHSSGGAVTGLLNRRGSRKVVPGLPRPLTFKRMNSEMRDKLVPVPVDGEQRRAASADRRESQLALKRTLSPPPISVPSMSAPDVLSPQTSEGQHKPHHTIGGAPDSNIPAGARQVDFSMSESLDCLSTEEPPPLSAADSYYEKGSERSASDVDEGLLQEELEAKWILNLSMHFRDMSDREKFFVTYAEEPTKWRRVTVSCDYRELTPDSLEFDLKTLHYQRDKSARIYEAIRDSLPDIQFYDTVTNLKLQTADGRLHVHVTEDVNEIIPYPSLSAVEHLTCKRVSENSVCFDQHISGFVYKVSVHNKVYIKKEIPGPDAVEEFLYEINALCSLQDSQSVITFEGIIVDEKNELIKGLLIGYADQGALVDLLYDFKGTENLPWERRQKWARQIVQGLSEIHEAGFVQGDFTLSNIVIDHRDDAKIIDINRRGCPVGWEPPELARLIESGQRVSIYIGVKSDLFQLGMVLWALSEEQDEPERQERPLGQHFDRYSETPEWFRTIVRTCLSDSPKHRPSAKSILSSFPDRLLQLPKPMAGSRQNTSTGRPEKEYIDPAMAVDRDDISKHHHRSHSSFSNINMPSTEYIGSSSSYAMPHSPRGRSPVHPRSNSQNRRSDYSPYPGPRSVMSLEDSEIENELASLPASRETRWEQVYVDGDTKLVQRGAPAGHEIDAHAFSAQEPKDVCITTPPSELDPSFTGSKKSEESTPLNLSTVAELLPPPPPPPPPAPSEPPASQEMPPPPLPSHTDKRRPSSKASFSKRVHHLYSADDPAFTSALTHLETELDMSESVTSSIAPSRVGTGFSDFFHRPSHQDSGFNEPDSAFDAGISSLAVSFDDDIMKRSLEEFREVRGREGWEEKEKERDKDRDLERERLWDDKEDLFFGLPSDAHDEVMKPREAVFVSQTENDYKAVDITSIAHMVAGGSSGFSMPRTGHHPVLPIDHPLKPQTTDSTPVTLDHKVEEKLSTTTIRPMGIFIPTFHHKEAVDLSPVARRSGESSRRYSRGSGSRGSDERKEAERLEQEQDRKSVQTKSSGTLVREMGLV